MPDIRVDPISDDEVELWVELRNAIDPQLPVAAEGARRALEPTLLALLARLDGRPAGMGLALEQGDLRGTDVAVGFFGVPAASRGQGIGTALYRAVSDHARRLGKSQLQVDVWSDDADGLAFVERRGFIEVERFERVLLDLAVGPSWEGRGPADAEIVPFERCLELAPELYEIAREAAEDMPTTDPLEVSFEDWRGWEIERETLRHDLGQVALVESRPVGFGTITVVGETRVGWHSVTAVRRAWRRRGIATAIKRAEIDAARRAGLESLVTFSETRNVPMRTLNERLGYRPLAPQLRLRGPLAASAGSSVPARAEP